MLKISELVPEGAIITSLRSNDREGVVQELLRALTSTGAVPQAIEAELLQRILEREKKGSTGFGRGVAVPHVKHASITRMISAIGLAPRGLEFASLDRQPVYSVFLLVSPQDRPEDHLKAMEVLFKNLSKESFRRTLRQAQSIEDVRACLQEADAQHLSI